jgi:hypothetical protein
MLSTDVFASTTEASSVANRNSNKDHSTATAASATATASATTSITYGEILSDLCRRIEDASYYSGSSSTWFLRGALAKHEEKDSGSLLLDSSLSSSTGMREAFSPKGLTDVLVEKLLLLEEEESDQNDDDDDDDDEHGGEEGDCNHHSSNDETDPNNYENYLIVAKALAGDSSKYLPAIAASLSRLISSASSVSASLSSTTVTSTTSTSATITAISSETTSGAIEKRMAIAIPREFLQLWVSIIVEDTTLQSIHENLSDDLFRVFLQQQRLRDSSDPLALPAHALFCLVEGDSWHNNGNHSAKSNSECTPKSLSPPTTQATLRRASLLVRFLSHDWGCKALDFETKLGIATSSGALDWFVTVLGGRDCPTRHLKQRRETRLRLLDLLVDEWRIVTTSTTTAASADASTEWLFSPQLAEAVLLFFRETLRELVEDWNEHLEATLLQQCATTSRTTPQGSASSSFQSRTNHDLLLKRNQKALGCASLFVKFLARLPKACPVSSSLAIIAQTEASESWVCDKKRNGRDLLAEMLRSNSNSKEKGSSPNLQRLRLVRLLIDEFSSSSSSSSASTDEASDYDYISKKEWLSSPGILAPILEECARDPFLGSSAATDRFLRAYFDYPSWKRAFSKKPLPRAAPAAINIQIQASTAGGIDGIIASAALAVAAEKAPPPQPILRLSRWFLEVVGRFQQQQQQQPGQVPVSGEGGKRNVLRVLKNQLGNGFGIGNRTSNDDHYILFDIRGDCSNITSDSTSLQDQYSLFDGENKQAR